jgi:hypothetical protein
MLRSLLPLAILLLVGGPGQAQTEEGRPLGRFRMEQLQQSVGLPESQARAVVERWARYDQDQFEKTRQIQQLRHRFNDILLGPGAEEEKNTKVRPLLEQYVEMRHQQAELKLRFEEDIRAKLTPAQQVRLILHVEEMQRRVSDALRQGWGNRTGGRLGPRWGSQQP